MKVTLEEAEEIVKRLKEEKDASGIKLDITCPGGIVDIIVCDTLNELRTRLH